MTETIEIYIDGQMVDVSTDTEVQMEIKSNFLNDIDNIESNHTYTISLPKTMKNMAIMGLPDRLGVQTEWPQRYHACEYRRNGVPLIADGKATMTECSEDISLVMYWGNITAIDKLKEMNGSLCDLKSLDRVKFMSYNAPDDYYDFVANGYGYADYEEQQVNTESEAWAGSYAVTSKMKPTAVTLDASRKRKTGQAAGDVASITAVEDAGWQSKIFDFKPGSRAVLNGIAGTGEYRAWALLDEGANVMKIAEDSAMKLHGADMAKEYNDTMNGDIDVLDNYAEAATVKGITINVAGGPKRNIEWGYCSKTDEGINKVKVGEGSIAAGWSGEWNIETAFNKPKDAYVYVWLEDTRMYAYYVESGSTTGKIGESDIEWLDTIQAMMVVKMASDTPVAGNHEVQSPIGGAYLIVNNIVAAGGSPVLTLYYPKSYADDIIVPKAIQPSVTFEWINDRILENTGVKLTFPADIEAEMKKMAVPLINQEPDAYTYVDVNLEATGNDTKEYGLIKLNVSKLPDGLFVGPEWIYSNKAMKLTLNVQADVEFSVLDLDVLELGGNGLVWTYWDYVRVAVGDSNYYVGGNGYENIVVSRLKIEAAYTAGGMYKARLYGSGVVDVKEGDHIQLFFEHSEMNEWDKERKGLKLSNIIVSGIVADNKGMPYGGWFPIAKNLPDIPIVDYVKFLTLITGTFVKQDNSDSEITLVKYEDVTAATPLDWSGRLIAATGRNTPRELTYKIGDWARNNRYKWKEDEKTLKNYDGNIEIDNDTLEYERTVWELPFAASDEDRVPIRKPQKTSQTSEEGERFFRVEGYEYDGCEPRIMNVVEKDGKAALVFNIDLDKIFSSKYKGIVKMVQEPHVIKERLMLSNIEIASFDETQPIYLKQYGQAFVVTELRDTTDGYAEVTMIQIND